MLTTRDIVKSEVPISGDSLDDIVDRAVAASSEWIAGELLRYDSARGVSLLERVVDRVEYPRSIDGDKVRLRCYPIESVSEVVMASDREFDTATPLVEDENFIIDEETGSDSLLHLYGGFYPGAKVIRVTYTGGYWTDFDSSPPAGAIALPSTLMQAATRMAVHLVKHRDKFGERSINVGDMSVAGVKDELFKMVRQMIQPFKRYS